MLQTNCIYFNLHGLFSVILLFFATFLVSLKAKGLVKEMSVHIGQQAQIPCKLDKQQCGDLHNVKWYRNSERIYVFSDVASISRAEGQDSDRLEVIYEPNAPVTSLRLKNVQVTDEATYKCEITYMEVKENCDLVQIIQLHTLVKPKSVEIYKKLYNERLKLENDTILGPFDEDTNLELECVVEKTKPVPKILWLNGSHILENGVFAKIDDSDYVISASNKLLVSLSRGDLWKKYECRVESDALENYVSLFISFDINVRPIHIELTGIDNHVIQGKNVILKCNVLGARPAANITWFNGSEPISNDRISSTSSIKTDGTYFTESKFSFLATRFENGHEITCEAENAVLKEKNEPPMHTTIMLEVFYPPIISVSPENVTVNETANVLLICNYEANPQQLLSVTWLKNNQKLNTRNNQHFEGGTIDNPSIILKNVTRDDLGEYSCKLENVAGVQQSTDVAFVNVLYPPIVKLVIEPSNSVIANRRQSVTLQCELIDGNPIFLDTVRWFLNGSLLKELTCNNSQYKSNSNEVNDSNEASEEKILLCNVDPSKLLLKNVNQGFAGNYSCDATNFAGLGNRSKDTQLIVYYPPSEVSIDYEPKKVIKKSMVNLICHAANRGVPSANLEYVWYRGQHLASDVNSANWTITPVTLQTENNFTCIARNLGGDSEAATIFIDVHAPPTFISKLSPYSGALFNSNNISLSCRVECSPECSIIWLKNGEPIDLDHTYLYYVRNILHPSDFRTNDFESIQSILIWNMTSWHNKVLNKHKDNANYTCQSTSNSFGPGVQSTTYFAVEYPPENINVSNRAISVIENNMPEKILCWAKAHPDPSYVWKTDISRFDNDNDNSDENDEENEQKFEVISKSNALLLNSVNRSSSGYYICEAFNRHGNITQKTYLNVMYKPECSISQDEFEDNAALVCSVNANPEDVNFEWRIKGVNETVIDDLTIIQKGLKSYLILDSSVDSFRTYLCYANNSIGISGPCERDVAGTVAWWKKMDQDHLIIIIAIIVAVIVCFFVICIILIIICKRKQKIKKYKHKTLDNMDERQNDGNSTLSSTSNTVSPNSKWPLKPGVHVHVNKTHSLSPVRLQYQTEPKSDESNTKQKSQKNLFKNLFLSKNDFLSNIHHGSNGIITFKKFKNCSDNESRSSEISQGLNPTNTMIKSNKNTKGAYTNDNTEYYENLPFHGLQNNSQHTNKPIPRIAPFITEHKRTKPKAQHKCYSPTMNSLPCRKHGYRKPIRSKTVEIHFIPKKRYSTLPGFCTRQLPKKTISLDNCNTVYQNLSDSIQIYEHDDNDNDIAKSLTSLRTNSNNNNNNQTSLSSSSSSSINCGVNQYLTFPKRQRRQSKLIPKALFESDTEFCPNSNIVIGRKKRRNILPLFDIETGTAPLQKSHSFRFESAQAFFQQQELKNKRLTQKKSRRKHQYSRRVKKYSSTTPHVQNPLATLSTASHKRTNRVNGDLIYADLEMVQMNVYRTRNCDENAKEIINQEDEDEEEEEDGEDEDLNRKFVLPQKIVTEYATLRFFNDIGHQIDV